ncbi:hypothetical protein [Massilia antarctica]|uniref:hypothetical protein n=1 Tax=Massilia antarctica TaxID=2765360 RepID=UPI000A674AD7|nr:hypothetical protein [Massilia sp. H27-R4]MCY0915214.1 hypothetical protein [Massilia sp. H27-R4]
MNTVMTIVALSTALSCSSDTAAQCPVGTNLRRARAVQLSKLATSGRAKYLAALSNHSKHRSTVKNLVSLDMMGTDPEPIRLNFESFNYGNKEFDQHEVLPLLEAEFNRISKIVVDSGIELHRILQAKFSSSKPLKGRAAN